MKARGILISRMRWDEVNEEYDFDKEGDILVVQDLDEFIKRNQRKGAA